MPHNPIPPADAPPPQGGDAPIVDWATLEALAAGELDTAAANSLRNRLASDDLLAGAFAQVENVQRQLDQTVLVPMPEGLLGAVMGALPTADVGDAHPRLRLVRWPQLAAGWAAAVLLSLAGWLAIASAPVAHADTGKPVTLVAALQMLPAGLSDADDLPTAVESPLPDVRGLLATASPDTKHGIDKGWPWLLGGMLLVGVGTMSAVRAHRNAGVV